jgi:L-ascorbate metabolism protein UlaG (beta-lactamase superfamily)
VTETLDYTVLSSGSIGNAVRIRNIMIDCGIAFSKMKEELYKCQYLLITHDHQDHVKPAVLNQIVTQFPNIEIYSTYKVARMNDAVTAINTDYLPIWLQKARCNMWAVPVPHNTLCFGYVLRFEDLDILYATDLKTTEELEAFTEENGIRYDYTFLEANYDETKLRLLGDSWHGQYNAYVDSSERHLARDESLRFYAKHRKEGGEYIELHKSTRFY